MKIKEKIKKDKQSIAAVISAVIIILTLIALLMGIIHLAVEKGYTWTYKNIPSITDTDSVSEETTQVIPEIAPSDKPSETQEKPDIEVKVEEYTHDLSAKVEDVKIERETKEKPNE